MDQLQTRVLDRITSGAATDVLDTMLVKNYL
jgi:hypothetical protein